MTVIRKRTLWYVWLLLHYTQCVHSGKDTCDNGGVCTSADIPVCGHDNVCMYNQNNHNHNNKKHPASLYRYGGTAQAYKPHAPHKSTICSLDNASSSMRHRVATWAYSRSSRSRIPRIQLTTSLYSCRATNDNSNNHKFVSKKSSHSSASDTTTTACCCQPMTASDMTDAHVEIWQTRPDGTYSSLRPGIEDGVCRAQLPLSYANATLTWETLAPGSTGSVGGIGPARMDTLPYGPPVLHILVTGPRLEATLMDIPILMDRTTLQPRTFASYDWRGVSWVHRSSADSTSPYRITSWHMDASQHKVDIGVTLFVAARDKSDAGNSSTPAFCESWMYGTPSSFFIEPITMCGSSTLDFFAL
jgi:hypothetical protein